MTFKVKNGLQIGNSVIFDANGNLVSNIGVGTIVTAPAGFAKFIAIGDNDSGIGQRGDGSISIASNNRNHTEFNSNGHIYSNCTGGEIDFFIGPQTNVGYLYGNASEIGFYSSTTGGQIAVSKDSANRYINITSGTDTGLIQMHGGTAFLIGAATASGYRIQNTTASGSNTAYAFNDYTNENNQPTARIYVTHQTNGGSTMRFDTTPPGARTSDRCVGAMTLDSSANMVLAGGIYIENNKAIAMKNSAGTHYPVMNVGTDNYVNIWNAGNAGVRILNQLGSAELFRVGTSAQILLQGNAGTSGQVLMSQGASSAAVWGNAGFTMGTPVATTSGSVIDITGIPSSATYIVVSLFGVSTSTTTAFGIQIGDSGGVETSGYAGNTSDSANNTAAWSTKIELFPAGSVSAVATHSATITLTKEDSSSNSWSISVLSAGIGGGVSNQFGCGRKSLTTALDRVRLMGGTFDAGEMNIAYA